MNKRNVYSKLSEKHDISIEQVRDIIASPFNFIREKMLDTDFDSIENKEQYDQIKVNFGLKYLGVLYTKYEIVKYVNKKKEENGFTSKASSKI